jgi:hypothetical protein
MTREAPKHRISDRAKRVWGKLQDWYGDKLEQFGPFPPQDWCDVIDTMDLMLERRVLPEIRQRHTTFPPTFPEFEALVKRLKAPAIAGPSIVERLDEHVMRTRRMTFMQTRQRTWLRRGGDIVGLEVPADGDTPGFRVMVNDLDLSQEFAQ